jgi:hypothetical protein
MLAPFLLTHRASCPGRVLLILFQKRTSTVFGGLSAYVLAGLIASMLLGRIG